MPIRFHKDDTTRLKCQPSRNLQITRTTQNAMLAHLVAPSSSSQTPAAPDEVVALERIDWARFMSRLEGGGGKLMGDVMVMFYALIVYDGRKVVVDCWKNLDCNSCTGGCFGVKSWTRTVCSVFVCESPTEEKKASRKRGRLVKARRRNLALRSKNARSAGCRAFSLSSDVVQPHGEAFCNL